MKRRILSIAIVFLLILCSCGTNPDVETTMPIEANTTESSVKSNDIPFYTKEIKDDPSDPYAADIKKRCEEVVNAWQYCINEDFDWFIKQMRYTYYSFYDLNGDGTDEMLLGEWIKVGKYTEEYNPPRAQLLSGICAIVDGKAEFFKGNESWDFEFINDRVLLSNNLIMTKYGNIREPSYSFYAFDGKNFQIKYSLFHSMPDDTYYDTVYNVISKDEYYRQLDEILGDATPVELEWKRIDQYGQ